MMSRISRTGGQVGTKTKPTDWSADWQCISQGSNIVSNIFETKSPNSAVMCCPLIVLIFVVPNVIKYVKFHAKDGPN